MQKTCYFLLPFVFLTVHGARLVNDLVNCDKNQEFKVCDQKEKRCPNAGPPSNLAHSDPGCYCKEGFARDYDENCVLIESCFPTETKSEKPIVLLQQILKQEEHRTQENDDESQNKLLKLLIEALISRNRKAPCKKGCGDTSGATDIGYLRDHIDIDHKHMEQMASQSNLDDRMKKIVEDYEIKIRQIESLKHELEIKEAQEKLEKMREEKNKLEKEKLEREKAERIRLVKLEKKRKLIQEKEKLQKIRQQEEYDKNRLQQIRKLQEENDRLLEAKLKIEDENKRRQIEFEASRCRGSGGTFDDILRRCMCTGEYENRDPGICQWKMPTMSAFTLPLTSYRLTTNRRCGGLLKGLLTPLLFGK